MSLRAAVQRESQRIVESHSTCAAKVSTAWLNTTHTTHRSTRLPHVDNSIAACGEGISSHISYICVTTPTQNEVASLTSPLFASTSFSLHPRRRIDTSRTDAHGPPEFPTGQEASHEQRRFLGWRQFDGFCLCLDGFYNRGVRYCAIAQQSGGLQ